MVLPESAARIRLPRTPEPPPPFSFPVVATIAPVIAAVVLWSITRSPLTLAFAALGPVIALASLADSRISARRGARRAWAAFADDVVACRSDLERAHLAERAALEELHPEPSVLLHRRGADPGRWLGGTVVAVGRGAIASRAAIEPPQAVAEPARSHLQALVTSAATLLEAPVVVDATLGIGVCGPLPWASAVVRALAVRMSWQLPPDRWWCGQSGHAWTIELPHPPGPAPVGAGGIQFGSEDGPTVRITAAQSERDLPVGCGVVLVLGAPARIAWHPDPALRIELAVPSVSEREARAWAVATRGEAARAGLRRVGSSIPTELQLRDVMAAPARPGGLAAVFAADDSGPLTIDLVAHGPHAVVGGTTGSGKSELLVAWVVALAAHHPPEVVSFLLVDFKGGAAFVPLSSLPHTAGILTDLDPAGASRALASLRAEVRHRERVIAAAGARDITGTAGLGRLVIMVDEFAAMLAEHPELHALFADLAARGRSLGIHLVLCTQRPTGAVRDSVLANADLRVSLRVNNRADSSAVVGTDLAAAIPAEARGRAVAVLAGSEPVQVQFALADEADIAAVAARWADAEPARRPWVEPLPVLVRRTELPEPDEGHPLGLLDRPDEQRRELAVWVPERHGGLCVLGAARSGVTTALAAIAESSAARWLPVDAEPAWDAIAERLLAPSAGVLVMDDLDALVTRFPHEHRTELVDRLVRLAREGPAAGLYLVAGMRRVPGELQVFASLLPSRLLLRHSTRQDLVLAGGDGSDHDGLLVPGRGTWMNARVQVATGSRDRPRDPGPALTPLPPGPLAVVTTRPVLIAERLARAGYRIVPLASAHEDPARIADAGTRAWSVVGDIDEWQTRWGALGALRTVASAVFDGCSTSDLRQLTRNRSLPPPIQPHHAWLLGHDGEVTRTQLPDV